MIETVVLLATLFAVVLVLIKSRFDVFKRRKIPYHPWNLQDFLLFRRVHFNHLLQRVFDLSKAKGPISGFFLGFTPVFLVNDPRLWRTISIKDFDCFRNRGLFFARRPGLLDANLLTIEDAEWKCMRETLSPQFSSGKIKAMLPTMLRLSDTLKRVLLEESSESVDWDQANVLQRFTCDFIYCWAFGIESNALTNPKAEYTEYVKLAARSASDFSNLKGLFKIEFRRLCRWLGMTRYPEFVCEFFLGIVKQVVKYREENRVVKPDILNAMIGLEGPLKMSVEQITAQSYIFLAAGLDTTANNLNYLLYYMAKRQDLQDTLREEIQRVLGKHHNEITYEALQEMSLVDRFIWEIMRRHPTSTVLIRQATQDYKVPDTSVVVRRGEHVITPITAMQMDPDTNPDPEEILLDRESPEILVFGVGPRSCIAERLAMVVIKSTLVNVLKDLRISATEKTPERLELSKATRLLVSSQRFHLQVDQL